MLNPTEEDERAHLERVKSKLQDAASRLGIRVSGYAQDVREQKAHQWDHRGEMDHIEKIAARQATRQTEASAEGAQAAKRRVERLLRTPYFGRLDFARQGDGEPLPVYIGVHDYSDDEEREHLVYDWRAPISTMFYDYELGEARYEAPSGTVDGEITVKRQYRIRHGQMEFMLESGLNIMDDVLQHELARTSDERMKNIVATIQRDQNAIIRNEDAPVLVIQGVAGSGKTSIALHRIAFLLYRFRDSLSSEDILIISPNKVFADFIANVLPELGEEQIAEIGMEDLAHELLGRKFKIQTFFEQTAAVLASKDDSIQRRIEEKSSLAFLETLDAYVKHVLATRFQAQDVTAGRNGRYIVPAARIQQWYDKRFDMPLDARLKWVAEAAEQDIWREHHYEITAKERAAIKSAVKKMYRKTTLRKTYKELFEWMGRPDLFKPARGSKLEYSDVFPLIYLKMRLEGLDDDVVYRKVKHLVVDEMQDYAPVQYAVLSRLFRCDKTLLGDVNQSVGAASLSTPETLGEVFPEAEQVGLRKSYRSSYEITQLAQSISPSSDLVAIERHGDKPVVVSCESGEQEMRRLQQEVEGFARRGLRTMGVICKTQKQAERLHGALAAHCPDVHLLTEDSKQFVDGVIVCAAYLAKGLEFDRVVVPHATADEYQSAMDRNLLYVACTRAMHELVITHTGRLTGFIANPALYDTEAAGVPA